MAIKVAIIGSTGSIGQQVLDVIESQRDKFQVYALAAGDNLDVLNDQIRRFQPSLVSSARQAPDGAIRHSKPRYGADALIEMVSHPDVDLVVMATPGSVGLLPTLCAIQAGKCIALSNKEVLVTAGELIMSAARNSGSKILPVDSEHSAIWQCLRGEDIENLSKIWLTASGGPFRDYPIEQLKNVTSADALRHPTWKMGKKVTIDSSTLVNKGFEVIEAHWLFGVPYEKIDVVVHKESVIHSMVEFKDGSIKAQLSEPDMRLPIQYALNYPDRVQRNVTPLSWINQRQLSFEQPHYDRFPALKIIIEAGKAGGTYPSAVCAADEVAVESFLNGKIKFLDIPVILQNVLEAHKATQNPSLEEILAADLQGRELALSYLPKL